MCPEYTYIQKLREANEAVASKGEGDSESLNLQGFTITLIGHLFDTQVFNQCLNTCEENGVNFRVVEWNVGNSVNQETSVSIQCISPNEVALDAARASIEKICADVNVRITEASGPSFDKKVLRKLNADHVH